jgi:hypothetical protein
MIKALHNCSISDFTDQRNMQQKARCPSKKVHDRPQETDYRNYIKNNEKSKNFSKQEPRILT